MIADIHSEFKLEEEDNQVTLIGSFAYGMSNGLGNFLNKLMMKKMNIKTWELFLAGIKHHIETGENIEKGIRLDTSVVSK